MAPEILGYAAVSVLGFFMLYRGTTDQVSTVLMGGAVCFILGVTGLVFAIRNVLWHRQMLRESLPSQKSPADR
jgi:hypothetical protein